ncbi:MAG: (2Fe-2S)-binding protein [Firmicutes bacterium]|nr:(2Fe-2S)-binding protein [Bacillota bacterium]
MLKNTGVPTDELIKGVYPNEQRRKKGPFAVIECFQKIPCDPCESSCSRGAVLKSDDINDLPIINHDKCNGCCLCASSCPGLAIFIINETYSDTHASVKVPYEFYPLPQKGDKVAALDRSGQRVCQAVIGSVANLKQHDRTPIVELIVEKKYAEAVRFFALEQDYSFADQSSQTLSKDGSCGCDKSSGDNLHEYICRCECITIDQIKRMIKQGYTTLNEMKIVSRAGMGACQGRTCRHLIMKIIKEETGIDHAEMSMSTFRPPTKPIKISHLCRSEDEDENDKK